MAVSILEQDDGVGNDDRITLHSSHLRLLFEEAGHLLPPTPADELAKRLAWQLCSVLRDIADQTGLSPKVDSAITTLTAYKESLPDSVFPHDLYSDSDADPIVQSNQDRPDFSLTHPTLRS